MKRRLALLLLLTAVMLTGCTDWMNEYYVSVSPHVENYVQPTQSVTEVVSTYEEIYDLLGALIEDGITQATVDVSEYNGDAERGLKRAISAVKQNEPLAAFIIDKISMETAEVGVRHIATIEISYNQNQGLLKEMEIAWGNAGIKTSVERALKNAAPQLILKVNGYQEVELETVVCQYYEAHPDLVMECPEVSAKVYPNRGAQRIMVINFAYQNTQQTLLNMAEDVQNVLSSAAVYVPEQETDLGKVELLNAFLHPLVSEEGTTSTPVYSLLRQHIGDSWSVAQVFELLCQEVNVTCYLVSGTKNDGSYYWNIVELDGVLCHLDLADSWELGELLLRFDDEMEGYVWDTASYPACIRPEEPDPDAQNPEDGETDPTESQPGETEPEDTTPEDTTAPTETEETEPETESP